MFKIFVIFVRLGYFIFNAKEKGIEVCVNFVNKK